MTGLLLFLLTLQYFTCNEDLLSSSFDVSKLLHWNNCTGGTHRSIVITVNEASSFCQGLEVPDGLRVQFTFQWIMTRLFQQAQKRSLLLWQYRLYREADLQSDLWQFRYSGFILLYLLFPPFFRILSPLSPICWRPPTQPALFAKVVYYRIQ